MEILTAKEAEEVYKSYDEWQYADREAAWKWMFERGVEAGVKAEREACAKVCEGQAKEPECTERAQYCADAIRNRK